MSILVRALLLQHPCSLGEMPLEAGFSHKAVHCGLQTSLCCGGEECWLQAVKVVSAPLPFGALYSAQSFLGFHLDKPHGLGGDTHTAVPPHR